MVVRKNNVSKSYSGVTVTDKTYHFIDRKKCVYTKTTVYVNGKRIVKPNACKCNGKFTSIEWKVANTTCYKQVKKYSVKHLLVKSKIT